MCVIYINSNLVDTDEIRARSIFIVMIKFLNQQRTNSILRTASTYFYQLKRLLICKEGMHELVSLVLLVLDLHAALKLVPFQQSFQLSVNRVQNLEKDRRLDSEKT